MKSRFLVFFLGLLFFVPMFVFSAPQRLVLMGGGNHSKAAISRFVEWAGGKNARIFVLSWGTEDPTGAFDEIKDSFNTLATVKPGTVVAGEIPETATFNKVTFLKELARSTGVFFTGGDQTFIMQRVMSDPELLPALRSSYQAGAVFGGTSAGTAIMSELMITGKGDFTVIKADAVDSAPGLGLAKGFIVDQHFIKRQRQNRIFSLLQTSKERVAIGVDEGNALAVENSQLATVLGPGYALVFENRAKRNKFNLHLLGPGDWFDIVKGNSSQS